MIIGQYCYQINSYKIKKMNKFIHNHKLLASIYNFIN